MAALLSEPVWLEDVRLSRVNAEGTLGYLKLQLRLRTPLDASESAAPAAPPRGQGVNAAPPPAAGGRPRAAPVPAAAAEEEEDDMEFANAIVSYNVLEWELGRVKEQVAAMQAKGQPVPFPFESRQQALEFRQTLMQIQVDTGQLSMEDYLQQLREAIAKETARAKALVNSNRSKAAQAVKRVKIMKEELEGATQAE